MTTRTNRQIRLAARPKGLIKDSDFTMTEEAVPEVADGQVLVKTLYFPLDPAIRNWMDDYRHSYVPPIGVGDVMSATVLGKVIESRNVNFAPGDITWFFGGWEDYSVMDVEGVGQVRGLTKMEIDPAIPMSNYLSICGTTGLTSYFGLLHVGKPELGETVLVSGAAGAVGSVVGQIAKNIKQCRVVGIAGGPEKCSWLTDELGFDAAIDYKNTADMRAAIGEHCPNGVDVFYDNVGGEILDAALMNLNFRARVVMCGTISNYGEGVDVPGPRNMWQLLVKNARIEGFTVAYYNEQWPIATKLLLKWRNAGLIKFREEVVEGLQNTASTFRKLFTGENQGRLIMKIADENAPD